MSGYASQSEVRTVITGTLRMEGRDPKDYNVTGIMRDAFYYRGPSHGYGAHSADVWDRAVTTHRRRSVAVRERSLTMPAAQRYQFEQRSGGRGAVVRIGPSGGKKVINVYKDQAAAQEVVDLLNKLRSREA